MDMTRALVLVDSGVDVLRDVLQSFTHGGLPRVTIVVLLTDGECAVWQTDGSVSTWKRVDWLKGEF
jgi:Mg-chelatase subunit ChlD